MDMYGFCCRDKDTFTVSEFFRKNLIGFGEFMGLKTSDIDYVTLPPKHKEEGSVFYVDTKSGPDEVDDPAVGPHCGIVLSCSSRLVETIEQSSHGERSQHLWSTFAQSYRIWSIIVKHIVPASLIPPSALVSFGYQEEFENLCRLYVENDWSTTYFRGVCDSAFIGRHVADLMTGDTHLLKELTEEQIANIIFTTRRENVESIRR